MSVGLLTSPATITVGASGLVFGFAVYLITAAVAALVTLGAAVLAAVNTWLNPGRPW